MNVGKGDHADPDIKSMLMAAAADGPTTQNALRCFTMFNKWYYLINRL